MMKWLIFLCGYFIFPYHLLAKAEISDTITPITWQTLATTSFSLKKMNLKDGLEILFPKFSPSVKALNGKKISLKGFVIPLESVEGQTVIILSKYPNSSCFFCGASGPETVVQIELKKKLNLRLDQIKNFTGVFRLNDTDISKLNFIIEDAE